MSKGWKPASPSSMDATLLLAYPTLRPLVPGAEDAFGRMLAGVRGSEFVLPGQGNLGLEFPSTNSSMDTQAIASSRSNTAGTSLDEDALLSWATGGVRGNASGAELVARIEAIESRQAAQYLQQNEQGIPARSRLGTDGRAALRDPPLPSTVAK